jgi:hypothetical protein
MGKNVGRKLERKLLLKPERTLFERFNLFFAR